MKWSDLTENQWYEIVGISESFETEYGSSNILRLKNVKNEEITKTFSISRLPIKKILADMASHNVFVRPKGFKISKKTGNPYHDFDIVKTVFIL